MLLLLLLSSSLLLLLLILLVSMSLDGGMDGLTKARGRGRVLTGDDKSVRDDLFAPRLVCLVVVGSPLLQLCLQQHGHH